MSKAITLVLGGMGVKGVASIGILQSLHNHNIKIKRIIASGISGLVSGQYALGTDLNVLTDEFTQFFEKNHRNLWGLEELSGLFQGRRSRALESLSYFLRERLYCNANLQRFSVLPWNTIDPQIKRFFRDNTFYDLKVPLAISAIDLKQGREVLLNKGSLYESMKASIAFPGLFTPIRMADMELVSSTLYCELPLLSINEKDMPVLAIDIPNAPPRHNLHSLLEIVALTDDIRNSAIKERLLEKVAYVLRLESMKKYRWGNYRQIPLMVNSARQETDKLLETITLSQKILE